MIRFYLLLLGFFISFIALSQKLEWEQIPAYKLVSPNSEEYKIEKRKFDSSLVNVLTKSKKLPTFKGFNFMNPYQDLHQTVEGDLAELFNYLSAARYYMLDSNTYTFENTGEVICFGYSSEYTSKFFKPFYFKNEEVSVGEYRAFLHYVRDSIIRLSLGEDDPDGYLITEGEYDQKVNWKKKLPDYINDTNYTWLLDEFFDKVANVYFKGDSVNVFQINRFKYEYWMTKKDFSIERKVINVLPDTSAWFRHFPYSWNEHMEILYNWHPAYYNYPVVGLNYEQVQAFLNWKENQLRKKFSNKNFEIIVSLPNPVEYEYAVISSFSKQKSDSRNKENTSVFLNAVDKVKFYSLILKDSVYSNRWDKIKKENKVNPYSIGVDGMMHTGPVDFVSKDYPELHVLDNGIKHLGSNVSEWMDYSFKDYQRYFNCQNLEPSNEENRWNKNYRMVMGGNWYDEKTTLNYGAPLNSIYSKTFAHKDSAFCTVGFRYVIRITQEPKSADNYINDINPVPNISWFDSLSTSKVKKLPNAFIKLTSLSYKVAFDSIIGKWNSREIIFVPEGLKVKMIDENVFYRDTISGNYTKIIRGKSMTQRQHQFIKYLKPYVVYGDRFYSITEKSEKMIGQYRFTCFDKGIIVLSQKMYN